MSLTDEQKWAIIKSEKPYEKKGEYTEVTEGVWIK